MKKAALAIAAAAAVTLLAVVGASSAKPPPPNVTCSQTTNSFSGIARDLIVPPDGYCAIDDATITHDLIVQHDSGGDVSNSTIGNDARYADNAGGDVSMSTIQHDLRYGRNSGGTITNSTIGRDLTGGPGRESSLILANATVGRDLVAVGPSTVQTGGTRTVTGPVHVGRDFVINGSPGPPDTSAFVFDGICDLTVGRDLRITNRWVTLGIGLGDRCSDSVGHDLVFSGNEALDGFFGPSALEVGDVTVGHNLTVTRNSAANYIEVANNTVTGDATCKNNSPPASASDVPGDGPNTVGDTNRGCP